MKNGELEDIVAELLVNGTGTNFYSWVWVWYEFLPIDVLLVGG
jgi:hypothetical protein